MSICIRCLRWEGSDVPTCNVGGLRCLRLEGSDVPMCKVRGFRSAYL